MFTCALCKKTFSHPSRLNRHMVTHTSEKPHKCLICSGTFGLESNLKRHIKVVHDGNKQTRNKNHHCKMCSYKCSAKGLLQIHVRKHSAERPFSCLITDCGFKTKYKSALSTHILRAHSDKRPFKCPSDGCSYKAKTRAGIRVHLIVHSNEKPFVCTVPGCDQTFKSKRELKVHTSRVHVTEKPFKCSVCDYNAKAKYDVTQHQLTHIQNKRYQCPAENCGYASHQSREIKMHFDRKHRNNEVLCTEPRYNLRFGSVALLRLHLKLVHKRPMLKCPGEFCGFSTRYKENLLKHISRRHKGFQSSLTVVGTRIPDLKTVGTMNTLHCSFTDCNFQTKFRQLYDRHVVTHKKEEQGQHVCSFCFSRFSKPSQLKAHLPTHVLEKPYSCSHCYFTTICSYKLKKHARNIHQIHVIPTGKDDQVTKCLTCGRNCFSYGDSVLHSMSHLQPVVVLKQLKLHVS